MWDSCFKYWWKTVWVNKITKWQRSSVTLRPTHVTNVTPLWITLLFNRASHRGAVGLSISITKNIFCSSFLCSNISLSNFCCMWHVTGARQQNLERWNAHHNVICIPEKPGSLVLVVNLCDGTDMTVNRTSLRKFVLVCDPLLLLLFFVFLFYFQSSQLVLTVILI